MLKAPLLDLRSEHRAEPVPPEPHRLVADLDAALEQQVLDLAKRQRVPNLHHHRQADHLRRTVEIAEGIVHPPRLSAGRAGLKGFCSDNVWTRLRWCETNTATLLVVIRALV
jgi:hypothetical protein